MLTNVASQNESKSLMRQVVTCHKKNPCWLDVTLATLIGRDEVMWPCDEPLESFGSFQLKGLRPVSEIVAQPFIIS